MPTGLAILAGLGQGLGKFPEGLLSGLKLEQEERQRQREEQAQRAAEAYRQASLGLGQERLGLQREQLATTGAHRQAQEERAERALAAQTRFREESLGAPERAFRRERGQMGALADILGAPMLPPAGPRAEHELATPHPLAALEPILRQAPASAAGPLLLKQMELTKPTKPREPPQSATIDVARNRLIAEGKLVPGTPAFDIELGKRVERMFVVPLGGDVETPTTLLERRPRERGEPLLSRELPAAQLQDYVHRETLESPPPGSTAAEIAQSGQYVVLPTQQVNRLPQLKNFGALLSSIEAVIRRRPDLYPPLTGDKTQDTQNVLRARVKLKSLTSGWSPMAGIDPEAAKLMSNIAGVPTAVRTFGDVGNIAEKERAIAQEAMALGRAEGRETSLARLENLRGLVNEGLPPRLTFRLKGPSQGPRSPQGPSSLSGWKIERVE